MNNGQVISGRYRLKEIIGQGGMADVYLAVDEILDRNVAIKVLRSHLADDAMYVQRFAREASAAATLSHKNIVQIYDVGQEDGQYYIVMEHVPGATLKDLLSVRGALHIEEAVYIMKQIISGVIEAHKNGIIHRDLKPQNILVTDSGLSKIADFGIAMIQSFVQVTETKSVLGSLHYLSPEIIRGEKATEQSDIYALGIMFYELLRGEVPFNDDQVMKIAMQHMKEPIPSIREFNPTISQGIENVIIKATAKNKAQRFENASDMLYALEMAMKVPNQEKLVVDNFIEDSPISGTMEYNKDSINEPKAVKQEKKEVKAEKKTPSKRSKATQVSLIAIVAGIAIICVLTFILRPKPFEMPSVANYSLEEAKQVLAINDLVLDESLLVEEYSDTVEVGRVIKSNPQAGSEVKSGDKVYFVISKGKEIRLSNYEGKIVYDVEKELKEYGYKVIIEYEQSEKYANNIIISQSVKPGTLVDQKNENLEITLKVSEGFSLFVESVLSYDLDAARRILEGKNIRVGIQALDPPVGEDITLNVVVGQSIENDYIYSSSETVILYYYDHYPTQQEPQDVIEDGGLEENE